MSQENMCFSLVTAAAAYPVSLVEMKNQIRLTSGSLADNLTTVQSIAPGAHVPAASYTLVGAYADVSGYSALVKLNSGTNLSGGTVDVKIQESDTTTLADFTDWTGGAFTQVATANDNAVYEKEYTGTKQYIRVVCTVAVANCDFSIDIEKYAPYSTEDDLITACIAAATEFTENLCGPLVSKVYDGYLDEWPDSDTLTIPMPRGTAITSIGYYPIDELTATTYAATNYLTDFVSLYSRVKLKTASDWPSDELREINAVVIRLTAGYANAAAVPYELKAAIKLLAAHLYENREPVIIKDQPYTLPMGYESLIANYRDWGCPK